MEDFNKKEIVITVCGLIFIAFVVGAVAMVSSNGKMQLENLNSFGDFFGGVLGPIFSLITIFILLKEKEESDKRNSLDSALKAFDYMKPIFASKEQELRYYGHTIFNIQSRWFTGFEVVDHFQHQTDFDIFTSDTLYVFEWIEEYTSKLLELKNVLSINIIFQDMFVYEFSQRIQRLVDFSLAFKDFEKMGVFEDQPDIQRSLRNTRHSLLKIYPDYLILGD